MTPTPVKSVAIETPSKTAVKTAAKKAPAKKSVAKKLPIAPASKKSVKVVVNPSPVPSPQLGAVTSTAASGKKNLKIKKPKMIRDSFTIPKPEYQMIEELKLRATKLTRPVKKSELLRAGIKALAAMRDGAFLTALAAVPPIKTGRPPASSSTGK